MKKVTKVSQGLGWFSIGLGLTELLFPRALGRFLGVQRRTGVIRLCGLREIATGIGLLRDPSDARWLRGRVAGDAMDLQLLGLAFRSPTAKRARLALATASVIGISAVDYMTERSLQFPRGIFHRVARVTHLA